MNDWQNKKMKAINKVKEAINKVVYIAIMDEAYTLNEAEIRQLNAMSARLDKIYSDEADKILKAMTALAQWHKD